jgi:hypothetical protein
MLTDGKHNGDFMTTPGSAQLLNARRENFCKLVSAGVKPVPAYMRTYESADRNASKSAAYRMLKNPQVAERVAFLTKERTEAKLGETSDVDFRAVIKTCNDIIADSEKTSDKLSAINTLNKLGVFDDAAKGDGKQMDPGSVCEYLARFAGNPEKSLKMIPGGLKGLLERLMDLAGVWVEEIRVVLAEIEAVGRPPAPSAELTPKPPDPVAPEPDEEAEIEKEAANVRLAQALRMGLKMEDKRDGAGTGRDKGAGEIFEF